MEMVGTDALPTGKYFNYEAMSMVTITCKNCKQEITVPMYFSNIRIATEMYSTFDNVDYHATATGKAICPLCGAEVWEIFSGLISESDIISFATKRYNNQGGNDEVR